MAHADISNTIPAAGPGGCNDISAHLREGECHAAKEISGSLTFMMSVLCP